MPGSPGLKGEPGPPGPQGRDGPTGHAGIQGVCDPSGKTKSKVSYLIIFIQTVKHQTHGQINCENMQTKYLDQNQPHIQRDRLLGHNQPSNNLNRHVVFRM